MTKKARPNNAKSGGLSLPETLQRIRFEKCVKTIAAKVEPSLAEYIMQHGGSTFIHTLILQSLHELAEGPRE